MQHINPPRLLAAVLARQPTRRGFTLVEVGVVLAVSAVLAALAAPSFLDQLARSRRIDASAALQGLEWAQERHRQAHGRYAERLGELRASGLNLGLGRSAAGHYRLELLSHGPQAYEGVARAAPSQARDRDCQSLTLRVQGAITQRQPSAACWSR